jgi:hypothetical protein
MPDARRRKRAADHLGAGHTVKSTWRDMNRQIDMHIRDVCPRVDRARLPGELRGGCFFGKLST